MVVFGNPLTGVTGKVTITPGSAQADPAIAMGTGATPIKVAHITRWSADIRRDVGPNETFDNSENFKRKIGGMYDIAGTCEGWMDDALAFNLTNIIAADYLPPDTALILLGVSATVSYEFEAIISNINMQVAKGSELSRFTLAFESNSAITVLGGTGTA